MAAGDYRSCDVCGGKCFYDANLNYEDDENEWNANRPPFRTVGLDPPSFYAPKLDYLGDWAVICNECAKTHKCVIVKLEETP